MTTIAAIHIPGKGTVIGADSRITTGNNMAHVPVAFGKVIALGRWAVAVSGELRTMNLLDLSREAVLGGLEDVRELPARLVGMMKNNDYEADIRGGGSNPHYHNQFVVANDAGAWRINGCMSLESAEEGLVIAGGSGFEYAVGADFAIRSNQNPRHRVRSAIEAGCRFDTYSGGRIDLFEIKASARNDKQFSYVG